MRDAHLRQLGDLAEQRIGLAKALGRGRLGRAEQAVVVVDRDLRREHVLACVLVVAVALSTSVPHTYEMLFT